MRRRTGPPATQIAIFKQRWRVKVKGTLPEGSWTSLLSNICEGGVLEVCPVTFRTRSDPSSWQLPHGGCGAFHTTPLTGCLPGRSIASLTVVTQGQLASVLLLHWVDDKPVKTECAKMALSTSSHPVLEPVQTIYGTADAQGRRAPTASKATALDVLKRSRDVPPKRVLRWTTGDGGSL